MEGEAASLNIRWNHTDLLQMFLLPSTNVESCTTTKQSDSTISYGLFEKKSLFSQEELNMFL